MRIQALRLECFSGFKATPVQLAAVSTDADAPVAFGKLVAFHSDHCSVPLPEKHRFPMDKYRLTRLALQNDERTAQHIDFRQAPFASKEELARAHSRDYIERFFAGHLTDRQMRGIGFPWSEGLVHRARASAGGTLAATRALLEWKLPLAANIADVRFMVGGTHHAFAGTGEGFCGFNDIAVAIRAAQAEYGVSNCLVVDLDVHQGNGTAEIFEGDDSVTTFDMHGDRNYPWKTRRKNTYDIALADATEDAEYLAILNEWLPRLLESHRPQLVFFQAGVDALKGDAFGRLALTRKGLADRNTMVYSTLQMAGVPAVITMGGGYSRPIDETVQAHADVYRAAAHTAAHQRQES